MGKRQGSPRAPGRREEHRERRGGTGRWGRLSAAAADPLGPTGPQPAPHPQALPDPRAPCGLPRGPGSVSRAPSLYAARSARSGASPEQQSWARSPFLDLAAGPSMDSPLHSHVAGVTAPTPSESDWQGPTRPLHNTAIASTRVCDASGTHEASLGPPRAVLTTAGYPGISEALLLDTGTRGPLLWGVAIQTWTRQAVRSRGRASHHQPACGQPGNHPSLGGAQPRLQKNVEKTQFRARRGTPDSWDWMILTGVLRVARAAWPPPTRGRSTSL